MAGLPSGTIDRRGALAALGAGALAIPGGAAAAEGAARVRFLHGVASGDPTPAGAILWTRATADRPTGDVPLSWHVAPYAGGKPVRSGRTIAREARDHIAKLEVAGLGPGLEYFYWFEAPDGTRSPTGRFRTLPRGRTDDWVIAAACCASYSAGIFNGYDAIARLERVDMVLYLGDYIYEYGPNLTNPEAVPGRVVEPAHEILTLDDYRRRHAQVKRDPDAQAMHARAAMVAVWDDHEVCNNSWYGGAENHQPATEGDWGKRKAAAMQAYFEWMPIRDPLPGQPWEAINRSFEIGDLATIAMVETRLLARNKEGDPTGGDDPALAPGVLARTADPAREMMGASQQAWLERVLTASVAAGKPWQLLGNQVVMARTRCPDFTRDYPASKLAAAMAALPPARRLRVEKLMALGRNGVPWSLDTWDGYPAARERLYTAFARAGSRPIVLSGDSHASWANDLRDAAGRPAAVEFGAPGITSAGFGTVIPDSGRYFANSNEEVLFCDHDHRGYVLLTLKRGEAIGELLAVSTMMAKAYTLKTLARFRCRHSHSGLEQLPNA